MKVIAISDTHGSHEKLTIPEGDIIIHCGDMSKMGTEDEINPFLKWFSKLPHQHKILIAGNHDFLLEKLYFKQVQKIIPSNITYLNETGVEIDERKIWGSPYTPIPGRRWAFNCHRGKDIQERWDRIPPNLDLLMTHGPPFGILDLTTKGANVGCENLLNVLRARKPKKVVFGHIHEARGIEEIDDITYYNASSIDRYNTKVFPPMEFDI